MAKFTQDMFWDHALEVSQEVANDLDSIMRKLEDLRRDIEESESEGVPQGMKDDLNRIIQKTQEVYDAELAGFTQKIENHQNKL